MDIVRFNDDISTKMLLDTESATEEKPRGHTPNS